MWIYPQESLANARFDGKGSEGDGGVVPQRCRQFVDEKGSQEGNGSLRFSTIHGVGKDIEGCHNEIRDQDRKISLVTVISRSIIERRIRFAPCIGH